MRCEDTAAHAADYLAGTLPDEVMGAVRRHAAECDTCRSELAALDSTWQMLDAVAEPRPDSAAMHARFEAVLDGYQEALADKGPRASAVLIPSAGWPGRVALPLAAAAVLVIGVGIGRLTRPAPASTPADPQLATLRQEVGDLREMVMMSLLQQQSAAERLQGVSWTGRIERPGAEVVSALLDTLLHDANVNVRLASVEALKRFGTQDTVRRTTLDTLPRQPSPLVQIALIDFVVESSGENAVDTLRRLARDETVMEAVRTRASQGLEQLGVTS